MLRDEHMLKSIKIISDILRKNARDLIEFCAEFRKYANNIYIIIEEDKDDFMIDICIDRLPQTKYVTYVRLEDLEDTNTIYKKLLSNLHKDYSK